MTGVKSIVTRHMDRCFMCHQNRWIEIHHIFGAGNRNNSTKYGLVVPLCHWCHNEYPNGVHQNKENRLLLQRIGQRAFEKHYPDLKFIEIFGKNFL